MRTGGGGKAARQGRRQAGAAKPQIPTARRRRRGDRWSKNRDNGRGAVEKGNDASNEQRCLSIISDRIRTCAEYKPKFGQGGSGLSYIEFQNLYRADRFYSWLGLNSSAVYAAHRTAGGLSSLYRQIGSGCEEVFRSILQGVFDLPAADVHWSFRASGMDGTVHTLRLDARVDLDRIQNIAARKRLHEWVNEAAAIG